MAAKRFGAYVRAGEAIELDMMRVELDLSQTGAQSKKDSELLSVMRLATQKVMDDIRQRKRREMNENPDSELTSPIATWEDVCDEIGFPKEAMRRILARDPRTADKMVDETGKAKKDREDMGAGSSEGEASDES